MSCLATTAYEIGQDSCHAGDLAGGSATSPQSVSLYPATTPPPPFGSFATHMIKCSAARANQTDLYDADQTAGGRRVNCPHPRLVFGKHVGARLDQRRRNRLGPGVNRGVQRWFALGFGRCRVVEIALRYPKKMHKKKKKKKKKKNAQSSRSRWFG